MKKPSWVKRKRARDWLLFWTITEWEMRALWRVPRLKRIRFFKTYEQVEKEMTK